MVEGILGAGRSLLRPLVGLRVSGSRNGVFSSRRVRWFPGCFQFPGWGVFSSQIRACCSPEWCVGRPWVFSVPGMVFPVPGQRERHGGVCGSRTVFLLASSCFSAFLCSLLPSFFFLFSFLPLLPRFLLFLFPFLRSCLPPSLSPPALPLIFLRSFPVLLPALASFPSLSFPFRPLPEFPSRT